MSTEAGPQMIWVRMAFYTTHWRQPSSLTTWNVPSILVSPSSLLWKTYHDSVPVTVRLSVFLRDNQEAIVQAKIVVQGDTTSIPANCPGLLGWFGHLDPYMSHGTVPEAWDCLHVSICRGPPQLQNQARCRIPQPVQIRWTFEVLSVKCLHSPNGWWGHYKCLPPWWLAKYPEQLWDKLPLPPNVIHPRLSPFPDKEAFSSRLYLDINHPNEILAASCTALKTTYPLPFEHLAHEYTAVTASHQWMPGQFKCPSWLKEALGAATSI